jgi:hypothetical protein
MLIFLDGSVQERMLEFPPAASYICLAARGYGDKHVLE